MLLRYSCCMELRNFVCFVLIFLLYGETVNHVYGNYRKGATYNLILPCRKNQNTDTLEFPQTMLTIDMWCYNKKSLVIKLI